MNVLCRIAGHDWQRARGQYVETATCRRCDDTRARFLPSAPPEFQAKAHPRRGRR